MKRIIALILMVAISISITACQWTTTESRMVEELEGDEGAYEAASSARDHLEKVYWGGEKRGLRRVGLRLCIVWLGGSDYTTEEIRNDGVGYLSTVLELAEEDVIEGVVYTMCGGTKLDYERASNLKKEEYRNNTNQYFQQQEGSVYHFCVMAAIGTLEVNGTFDEIESNLSLAKTQLDILRVEDTEDEHYSNLLGYYESSIDCLAYLRNPTGTYWDLSDAVDNYEEEVNGLDHYLISSPYTRYWVEEEVINWDHVGPVLFAVATCILVVLIIYSKKKEYKIFPPKSKQ